MKTHSLNRLYILISLGIVLPSILLGQTSDSLSLQQLAMRAIEKNRGIQNARLEIEKTDHTKSKIKHTFIPTLEASGRYAYTSGGLNVNTNAYPVNFPGTTVPPLLPGFPPISIPPASAEVPALDQQIDFNGNLWMGGLTAKWTLFTGLKANKLIKAVDHKLEAQKIMLTVKEAELITEVAAYYDKIALLDETQKVLLAQQKRLEKETLVAKKALENGLITPHQYQQIEIAQLTLEGKQLEFDGAKKMLYLKLSQLTGIAPESLAYIEVTLTPRVIPDTITNTYLDRAELQALSEAEMATEYKYKSEISGYLPKVQAFASSQYLGLTNGELGDLGYNEISAFPLNMVGVGFKWEIFDGLHTHGERQQLQIELQQTQNKKAEATELLALNYNNCLVQYHNLTAQVALNEKQVSASEKDLEISFKEYQNGLIQVSEFLKAMSNYTTQSLTYYKTLCNQRNATLELLHATGSLQISNL